MTHSERVLRLLSDGKPHGHMELYRLGVMAHSRVADLRKQGYRIECWREGDNYVYQLIGTVHEGADSSDGKGDARPRLHGPSLDESISPQRGPGGQLPDSEVHPAQLSVFEVAA